MIFLFIILAVFVVLVGTKLSKKDREADQKAEATKEDFDKIPEKTEKQDLEDNREP